MEMTEEDNMFKKPHIIVILIVVAVMAFLTADAQVDHKVRISSKASHAEELWKTSGHADFSDEPFIHWDEEGEIPTSCAKCHSTQGFEEFILTGTVSSAVPVGEGTENDISCSACHSDPEQGITRVHTSVTFPSDAVVDDLGPEALCMECHQGRESKNSVDNAIADVGATDDQVSSDLSFIDIHYYAAAADQFGTVVEGGYQYDGETYDARFSHVTGYNACITCHNPHSLKINLERCHTCHVGVADPKDIRFYGSFTDYNGNGNITEGIFYEIRGLRTKLYTAIKKYARNQIRSPIVYDVATYPYFFYDTNNNGVPDEDELSFGNRYGSFTPRLLKAAYNYQLSQKDPAGYAHNGKYIIELIYDSIEDLNSALAKPVDMKGTHRVDEGHFNGASEAWRHWDSEGEVEADCAKCHGEGGLAYFLANGTNVAAPISNGMLCTRCHTSPPNLRTAPMVVFPSGRVVSLDNGSNICMTCHQGRESMFSVRDLVNSSSPPWSFINIHYYPAAAVFFGTEVKGGFEFKGKSYAGQSMFPNHMGLYDTCVECHMGTESPYFPYDVTGELHDVATIDPRQCVYCHGQDISQPDPGADPSKFEFSGIRPASIPDYDGDGNRTESIKGEIKGLEESLYAEIRVFGFKIGNPIVYDPEAYPYFFNDLNGNGQVDPGENIFPNAYQFTSSKLLKAAYNFQLSEKEPHGYIHNSRYIAQLLVDSIGHLGGDVSRYTWRK
jgi:hypothetical protein